MLIVETQNQEEADEEERNERIEGGLEAVKITPTISSPPSITASKIEEGKSLQTKMNKQLIEEKKQRLEQEKKLLEEQTKVQLLKLDLKKMEVLIQKQKMEKERDVSKNTVGNQSGDRGRQGPEANVGGAIPMDLH